MNKIKYLLFIVTLGLGVSCGERSRITRGDLIDILTEMHLADATIMEDLYAGELNAIADSLLVYKPILDKYGYTYKDFTQSLVFYSKNPRKLNDLYEDVIANLQEQYDDAKTALFKAQIKQNIWKGDDEFDSPSDIEKYGIPLVLKIKGPGKYIIQMDVAFSKRDSSVFPRFSAVLYSPHPQAPIYLTETMSYVNIPQKTFYRLEVSCTDTLATELRMNLVEYDTAAPFSPHRIPKLEITNFMVRRVALPKPKKTPTPAIPPTPAKTEKKKQPAVTKLRIES